MKFGGLHDDGGLYFAKLGLEDSSKSKIRCCSSLLVRRTPCCTKVSASAIYRGCLVVNLTACVGIPKQELSEFIVSVIKGNADLTPRKKVVGSDAQAEPGQDSGIHEDTPAHEEL
jgi:hypothetical protein